MSRRASGRDRRGASRSALATCAMAMVVGVGEARAQTLDDALSLLLKGRATPTDGFVRDHAAAEATQATLVRLLRAEVFTAPAAIGATGLTYRLNRSLGVVERSTHSFGPFLVHRSLTLGRRQVAIAVAYGGDEYDALDGHALDDGTLVTTVSRVAGDPAPFDVETIALRVQTRLTVVSAHVGLTDRLDVAVSAPFVTTRLHGERMASSRGQTSLQASASATSSGIGDLIVRSKYNVVRSGALGVSAAAEIRLPTGDAANLRGAGRLALVPRLMASYEVDRVAFHGDASYVRGGVTDEIDLGAAATFAANDRFSIVGELSSRRLESIGRLEYANVSNVSTLVAGADAVQRISATAGFRWNVVSSWVVSASFSRPLTTWGFTGGWRPMVTLDCLIGR